MNEGKPHWSSGSPGYSLGARATERSAELAATRFMEAACARPNESSWRDPGRSAHTHRKDTQKGNFVGILKKPVVRVTLCVSFKEPQQLWGLKGPNEGSPNFAFLSPQPPALHKELEYVFEKIKGYKCGFGRFRNIQGETLEARPLSSKLLETAFLISAHQQANPNPALLSRPISEATHPDSIKGGVPQNQQINKGLAL